MGDPLTAVGIVVYGVGRLASWISYISNLYVLFAHAEIDKVSDIRHDRLKNSTTRVSNRD